MPAPQRADDFSLALLKGSAAFVEINLFDAIVALNAFERFVYVMSVLESQSDDDCSALLGCSRRDAIIARELARHIPAAPADLNDSIRHRVPGLVKPYSPSAVPEY
jgi:hypothetical protein